MESVDARKKLLVQWLQDCGVSSYTLQTLPGDASGRRYFRVRHAQGSYIAMDAPPPCPTNHAFVAIAKGLRTLGIHTPEIIHAADAQGFLLMTDFGDLTLLKILNPANADQLYQKALHTLIQLQQCQQIPAYPIPPFTEGFMWQEWAWHKEWFLGKLLALPLKTLEPALDACFSDLMLQLSGQPQVFMHRDYHSANLMLLVNNEIGVLDFQDAFIGPITYDLVSLLRDCYIAWPEHQVREWVIFYWELFTASQLLSQIKQETFLHWFDYMGIQRHLKALLTFSRKHIRDSQSQYLSHVPRTLNYILAASECYPALKPLHAFYSTEVVPAFSAIKRSV